MRAIKLIKNGEEHYIDSFSQENVTSMIERYTRDNPEVKSFPMPRSAEQMPVGDSLEEIWNSYSNRNVVILREYDGDEGWFYENLRYVTGIGGYDEYIMAEHDGVIKKFYLRGEGNNYYECVKIETEDTRKVKFFPMPQVGDNLSDIITSTMAGYNAGVYSEPSYLVVLRAAEDDTETTTWESRWIVQSYTESTQDPSFLVATHNGTRKKFYFDSNRECTSIVDENSAGHYEDLGFGTWNGYTLTLNTDKPAEGTIIRISAFTNQKSVKLESLSFGGGESVNIIRCDFWSDTDWINGAKDVASMTGIMTDAGFVVLERDHWNVPETDE